jgi:hypothetical protein
VAVGCILADVVVTRRLYEREFRHSLTQQVIKATHTIVLQYLMHQDGLLVAIFLLCAVMGFVLVFFTGYHIWLASTNVTTNETFKYSEARDAFERATRRWQAHHGALAALRLRIARLEALTGQQSSSSSSSSQAPDSRPFAPAPAELGASDEQIAAFSPKEAIAELDEICAKAGQDPRVELEALRMLDWSRNPGGRPVEPANIWDHGWRANLLEVLFPLSDRSAAERAAHRAADPGDYTGLTLLREISPDDLRELLVAANEPDVTMPAKLREAITSLRSRPAAASSAPTVGSDRASQPANRKRKV